MRPVFVDTFHWVAELNERDEWHSQSISARHRLRKRQLVTTEEVLSEVLAFFSNASTSMRTAAVEIVKAIMEARDIRVLPQSHQSFVAGLEFYADRPDKQYSLTDCTSMAAMKEHRITDVLTYDHHFAQEGFNLLLR